MTEKDIQRFWKFVTKDGPVPAHCPELGNCWEWAGTHQTVNGKPRYGLFWYMGGNPGAHRISWLIHHGVIAPGLNVCHKCDNPICVNPDHLFEATQKENIADKYRKGRGLFGDKHPNRTNPENVLRGKDCPHSILTEDQVREIKRLCGAGLKPKAIMKELGIQKRHLVENITRGNSWRHIK